MVISPNLPYTLSMKKLLSIFLLIFLATSRISASETQTLGGIFLEVFLDIMEEFWIESHIHADYDVAPYATRNYYVGYKESTDKADKFYRFQFETGNFYFPYSQSIGNESRIEGIAWKFFGPVFEHVIYTDAREVFRKGRFPIDGNLRLGLTWNIINFNIINLAYNLQWTFWYGSRIMNGLCEGLILRSYPIKPLLIEYRANWQHIFTDGYDSSSHMFESHLEVGFMVGKHEELFGAWKYFKNGYTGSRLHGFSTGVRLHL